MIDPIGVPKGSIEPKLSSMKFIQTFWTRPASNIHSMDIKGGWLFSESHWMSWALSCLQTRKFYGEIELVTDNRGKEILIDLLGLPYYSVTTELEGKLDNYPPQLWSLAKIYTYSIQREPFLHLDGDLFLWNQFDEKIMKAPIVAQNLELNLAYYRNILESIDIHFPFMPDVLRTACHQEHDINASNTGIFGGHNLSFIGQYCKNAFSFVDKNLEIISTLKNSAINFIFEQCLLYYDAKAAGQPITYLMDKPVTDPSYMGYARFLDIPSVNMLHTLGGYKILPSTATHLSKRLRKEYPDYYYRILEICQQQQIALRNKVYEYPPFSIPGFFKTLEKSENITDPFQRPAIISAHAGSVLPGYSINYQTAYNRTLAALKHIQQLTSENPDPALSMGGDMIDKIQDQLNAIAPDNKERVEEIFRLESKKVQLAGCFQDLGSIQENYLKDIRNYRQAEEIFNQRTDQIMATKIGLGDQVCIFDLSCSWNLYEFTDSLELFIKKKLKAESSLEQVALVPDWTLLTIDEIYLDHLEMIIVAICADEMTIKSALDEIKPFLDPNERAGGTEDPEKMILDALRRLLYAGILEVSIK